MAPHQALAHWRDVIPQGLIVAEAIALVLRLPARANITELVIKPTHLRSVDAELQKE